MTEKGKKPDTEAASQADPLSATGMFLNAFGTQPEPLVEQAQESPAKVAAKAQPGEFTQMFHKLEPPPAPALPQTRMTGSPSKEPGEFTRTFVAAATSPGLRPAAAIPDPAPFAPPTPKMRGFSTPGVSDSASAEGSFTQLFRTPPSPTPASPPLQPFTPLPSPPSQAAEPAWPQSLDPAPNGDRMAPGGLTQLFRSLSEEGNAAPSRIGESPSASTPPSAGNPASVTMLIQRLTEDLQQAAARTPSMPPPAAPGGLSGPGEFTRIIAGGVTNPASAAEAKVAAGPAAGNFAVPLPPAPAFPAAPVPAFAAPQVPAAPAPAFAAPQVPALAVPPAQPPKVSPSAPPQQSKLQQMLPMLLVLNAFLVVVLILLLVFALRSR